MKFISVTVENEVYRINAGIIAAVIVHHEGGLTVRLLQVPDLPLTLKVSGDEAVRFLNQLDRAD